MQLTSQHLDDIRASLDYIDDLLHTLEQLQGQAQKSVMSFTGSMEVCVRIGELGMATGVDIETIRYYEKIGLMPAPARAQNGYRVYSATHREQLEFIRHCRALDIALADIRQLIEFSNHPDLACDDIDLLIDEQLDKVRTRLAHLRDLEHQLLALRRSCGGSKSTAGCGILRELAIASHSDTDGAR